MSRWWRGWNGRHLHLSDIGVDWAEVAHLACMACLWDDHRWWLLNWLGKSLWWGKR